MSSNEWKKMNLGDFITFQRGFDLPESERRPGQIPVVSSSGVFFRHNKIGVRGPGVITGRYGTIGKVFFIKEDYWPLNTTLFVKDFHGNDPLFVSYFLKTLDFSSCSDKSSVPGVNRNDLHNLPISVPPLPTQHAIARILGSLDDKIELNRQMNETLEAMARAIFQSWFVDFDPVRAKADGRDTGLPPEISALFPDGFEEIDGRKVPRGWGVGTLDEIAENIRRPTNPDQVDPATPYIGLEHMPQHSIALCAWGSASTVGSGKFAFRKNEFLFGKLRPYFHKVGIAPVDGVCSTDILIINPKNDLWASYVVCCLSSNEFVEFATQGSDGTKMPRSSWSAMKKYPIIIPTKDIVGKFNSSILPLFEKINANIHESRTLAHIRDSLLPKLMSGEIRIDNDQVPKVM
jgi:type I restriction enzyme S subunit